MPSYVRGRKIRRITDEEIVKLYDAGLDAETIGYRAACSGTTVIAIVRAAGHEVRKPGRGVPRAKLIPDDDICARYRAGEDGPRLAYAAGCTAGTIYRLLRRHGVEIRPPASLRAGKAWSGKARRKPDARDG